MSTQSNFYNGFYTEFINLVNNKFIKKEHIINYYKMNDIALHNLIGGVAIKALQGLNYSAFHEIKIRLGIPYLKPNGKNQHFFKPDFIAYDKNNRNLIKAFGEVITLDMIGSQKCIDLIDKHLQTNPQPPPDVIVIITAPKSAKQVNNWDKSFKKQGPPYDVYNYYIGTFKQKMQNLSGCNKKYLIVITESEVIEEFSGQKRQINWPP